MRLFTYLTMHLHYSASSSTPHIMREWVMVMHTTEVMVDQAINLWYVWWTRGFMAIIGHPSILDVDLPIYLCSITASCSRYTQPPEKDSSSRRILVAQS